MEPPPHFMECDMCGGAGWVPAFVGRRDWLGKGWCGKGKGKGQGKGKGKGNSQGY